jgi:hypothetical protein
MFDSLGLIADMIGIVGAIFAVFAWWQSRKTNQDLAQERNRLGRTIAIKLAHGGNEIEIPAEIKRADFTRSEILGRIGMLPVKPTLDGKPGRFDIRYLNQPDFFKQLNQISDGRGDGVLTIPLTADEFNQFDL